MGVARWKTQPLSEAGALQMLGAHGADAHGQQAGGGGGAAQHGGEGTVLLAKIPRTVVSGGCN